jgi:lysophospholipase L1-like esterase
MTSRGPSDGLGLTQGMGEQGQATMAWRSKRSLLILIVVVVIAIVAGLLVLVWNNSPSRGRLVGLGDSYASGEGLSPYVAATDTTTNRCHESIAGAYSVISAKSLGLKADDHSCSGATTATLMNGDGSAPSQLAAIAGAKDITVTIGGNDIDALGAVLHPPTPQQLADRLDQLQPKLVDTFQRIHTVAPRAHIYATDYPDVLPSTLPSDCFLTADALTTLNSELAQLDSAIKTAAQTARVDYVEFNHVFSGHELCTSQPWVNGLELGNISASLHPNLAGQTAMAAAVTAAIKG